MYPQLHAWQAGVVPATLHSISISRSRLLSPCSYRAFSTTCRISLALSNRCRRTAWYCHEDAKQL